MSLNAQQVEATINELNENMTLAGITKAQAIADLGISETKFDRIMSLTQQSLDDPWIVRNYLLDKVEEVGKTPVPFTALSGDWHRHWFLNTDNIDQQKFTPGDF